jgi:hypothetical protein
VVSLAKGPRRTMLQKLNVLANFEKQMDGFLAERKKLQSAIADARKRDRELSAKVTAAKAEIAALKRRLQRLSSNPLQIVARKQLEVQIAARQAQLGALNMAFEVSRRATAELQRQFRGLKPPEQPPSVVSGPQPATLNDYSQLWVDFEESYHALKTTYLEAVGAFEAGRSLPRISKSASLAGAVEPALAKAGVAATTRTRVAAIRSDSEATQTALGDLVSLVAALKGEGIRVRVDPESISNADEAARQRVRLTFRSESQETVNVEGQERDLQ